MKFLQSILLTITFLLAGLACQAQFQSIQVVGGGTNQVAVATTNAYSLPAIVSARANALAIQCTSGLTVNSNTSVIFRFSSSIDNVYWVTNSTSVTVACTSTNQTSAITTVALGGIPFLRLESIENSNVVAVATNIFVKTVSKTGL